MRCIISEFHVVETVIKDEEVLLKSLKEMGYSPSVHRQPTNLYGYQGDKKKQKAHIIIPRSQVGSASNDVGFEKIDGKYVIHASEFDVTWRKGERVQTLNKKYGENKLKKIVSGRSDLSVFSRRENEKGQIEIVLNII